MSSKEVTRLTKNIAELTFRKNKLIQEIESLKELKQAELQNMEAEHRAKVEEATNELISVKATIRAETENMLDAHRQFKSRFFAPTQEQIDRFQEDIPAFLMAYCESGNITAACKKTNNLDPKIIHWLNATEPTFKEDFDVAKAIFADRLHSEAQTRALEGTETPLIFRGEVTGYEKMPDNRLLETVLRAQLPHLYDRKALDRIPDADKPQINVNIINFNDHQPEDSQVNTDNLREAVDVSHTTKEERTTD